MKAAMVVQASYNIESVEVKQGTAVYSSDVQ